MIKNKEVEAFYKELIAKGNLTTEEQKFLDSLLERDEVSNIFKGGLSATSRFHQEMDKLKKQEKTQEEAFNKKLQDLDVLQRTLSTTSSVDTKKIADLEQAMATKTHDLEQRDIALRTVKEKLNGFTVDDKPVLQMLGLDTFNFSQYTPKQETKVETKTSTQPSFTKEDILKELNPTLQSAQQALAKLPFDLLDYQQEYHLLTGKNLSAADFYNKVKEDGTGDYHSVYLKEYDIENLRESKKREAMKAEVQKELQEDFDRKLNERLAPASLGSPKESDFYKSIESNRPKEEINQSPVRVSERSSLIAEAVADFNKRKEAAA